MNDIRLPFCSTHLGNVIYLGCFGLLVLALSEVSARAQSITTDGTSSSISIFSGDTVTIHTERGNGTPSTTDWVALYIVGASDGNYIDWRYLNGTKTAPSSPVSSATFPFVVTGLAQSYEFRFYANNSYTRLATSGAVTINPPRVDTNHILPPQQVATESQEALSAGFIGGSGSSLDWIGLYASGAPNTSYLDWVYLNGTRTAPSTAITAGSVQMTLPSTDGTYEFRLLYNNGYSTLATGPQIRALTSPVTHTLNNGTSSVGINIDWGGAITSLSFVKGGSLRYRNLVNNEQGPGRQIEMDLYNSNNNDCWPCNNPNCVWGWNPVQSGNACSVGSSGTVLQQTPTTLVTTTTPLQWNNLFAGGQISNVTVIQTLQLVDSEVLSISYQISNNENFAIGAFNHEMPVVYLNFAFMQRAFAYQGSNPFTSDSNLTEFAIPCCHTDNNTTTTEPWIALVDGVPFSGSPLSQPAVALYVPGKTNNWNVATRTTTSLMQNWQTLAIPAGGQATLGPVYLVFGATLSDVRSRIYRLAGY